MCLLFFAINAHPDYRLIVAANRDEFYKRPTEKLHSWGGSSQVIAGKDLEKGGTWFGVTRQGRWAAVTNYRETDRPGAFRSRGMLVSNYLVSDEAPAEYIGSLVPEADLYDGFNLVAGTLAEAVYFSNRELTARPLRRGIFGLSNHLLDTPWPKVRSGKNDLANLVSQTHLNSDSLFSLLNDRTRAKDEDLPDSGMDIEWERLLSSAFISDTDYGTRSSTTLLIKKNYRLELEERTYSGGKDRGPDIYSSVAYGFNIDMAHA